MKTLIESLGFISTILGLLMTVNGVAAFASGYLPVYADSFPGADIAAKIANAFASCAGTASAPTPSCVVYLDAGQTYSLSTTISIPNSLSSPYIYAPVLDCNGSTIMYGGYTAPAVLIHGENAAGFATSGSLRNCQISGVTNSSGAVPPAIIQTNGRLGFTYQNLILGNATVCLDLINTNTDGGPGYQENNTIDGLTTTACASHIKLEAKTGATPSFEYNTIKRWHCGLGNKNICLDAGEAGTVTFATEGLVMDVWVNTDGNVGPGYVVYLDHGNSIFRAVINMQGENGTGMSPFYSVYVNSPNSLYYNEGSNTLVTGAIGFGAGVPHTNVVIHPSLQTVNNDIASGMNSIHYEPETGILAARHCKFDLGPTNVEPGGSFTYWMASYGHNENDCSFQILSRNTTTNSGDSDVDIEGNGAPATNVLYTSPFSGHVGIGPGYGNGTYPSGSIDPPSQLSVDGVVSATQFSTTAPGYTGTKTVGGCTFQFSGGIIISVTGC